MICENCGDEIRDGDRYCSTCGTKIYLKNYNQDKPLKRKFLRGEYWDDEQDFDQQDQVYQDETEYEREYYGEYRDYEDYEDYEEPKKSRGLFSTFLILLIALAAGFIIGVILFSTNLPSITSFIG